MLRRSVQAAIDWVSFSGKTRDLAAVLNQKVEQTEAVTLDLLSHPGGFRRAFHKRRIGIAECYLQIAQAAGPEDYQKRLHALKTLVELSLHAKTISMPVNTARVQIELMKSATKAGDSPRRQMELIADFSLASFGHEGVIRRLLKELLLAEVPERGMALRELDLGWDSHVHDNLAEGRKTPSQVLLDAFIKGLSRLTLVHFDVSDRDVVFETMKAGEILGIDVSVGIEFSVGAATRRKHFIYVVPATEPEAFAAFLDQNAERLAVFLDALEENRRRRRQTITEILQQFNQKGLAALNEGYLPGSRFALAPLRVDDLEEIVSFGQYSRIHLSELLFSEFKEVLRRRVIALGVEFEIAQQLARSGGVGNWELQRIQERYGDARRRYQSLNPDELRTAHFSGKSIEDYDSALASGQPVFGDLKALGGTLVYIHPLARGFDEAVSTVVEHCGSIDQIELFNMYDAATRDPAEISQLCGFVDAINNGTWEQFRRVLAGVQVGEIDEPSLRQAFETYHDRPLVPVVSSDSTGREPRIPGMGFVRESSLPPKSRKQFERTHVRLPAPVSALVTTGGKGIADPADPKAADPEHQILSMGKSSEFRPNRIGDEEVFEPIGPLRFWRYLNPVLKGLTRVSVGLVPAYLWIGAAFTGIWFGITFVRNVLADLFANAGYRPTEWRLRAINFDNATQSLFWTGFSVPILALVKEGFDLAWPLAPTGALFEWTKFLFICVANGTYIATHNTIRRFDRGVIKANFFRSLLAWPFAAAFAPLGNLLLVPSIVQAKFWSDVVAGFIEGVGKFWQRVVLPRRDLSEILPLLGSQSKEVRLTAMLDVLHVWGKRQRGRTALARLLAPRPNFVARWFGRKRRSPVPSAPAASPASSPSPAISASAASPLPPPPHPDVPAIVALFEPQKAHAELSGFVLDKYTSDEAVVLNNMVGRHLVPFHGWLKRIQ